MLKTLNKRANEARKNEKTISDKAAQVSIAYHDAIGLIHAQQEYIAELEAKKDRYKKALIHFRDAHHVVGLNDLDFRELENDK